MSFPLIQPLNPPPDVAETLRRFADWPNVVLFDSASRRPELGRYSFLAADPFEFQELSSVPFGVDPFAQLREWSQRFAAATVPELPPFQGGAAGFLSYELGGAWEQLPRPAINEFELPWLAVGLYDWVIAWDHEQGTAWILSHGFPAEGTERERRAAERMQAVLARLNVGDASRVARTCDPSATLPTVNPFTRTPFDSGGSNFSRDEYLRAVERVIEYIRAGDIFQVNLSQRLLFPSSEEALTLYLRLRQFNPAPFAGYFAHDDWTIASASPERFVNVLGGEVETRPIKGTRRRRHRPEADLFTEDELRESEKDQAENVMIVDLLRNDLSKVCSPGSIRVPSLCAVETYETVQHLVSVVRGTLGRDSAGQQLNAWDLLAALFPGGSITGAPKVRAMEIIAELEPTVRGPYCGSLFYVGFDGSTDSSILIRTFTVRRGWIQCCVGGGIVAQSDPAAEYEETLHKAAGMLQALTPNPEPRTSAP
ncbi:MAG: anthranilate synthase component I family protein [Planctomycetota bacterium]|nr:MAG: anthranilate synthase component I family protein [Planctomycetota bacterium]